MILLLDTSTPICRLTLVDGQRRYESEWQAERQLALGLLAYIEAQLAEQGRALSDVVGIGAFKGPGSFTGLRISLAVLNTMADALDVPIVGETGDNWQEKALDRLATGATERIIMPDYGGGANITKPRK